MTTKNENQPASLVETPDSGRCALAAGSALRCRCCTVGFPVDYGGWHIPTQALGMIPATKCTLVRRGDVARFREYLNAQDSGIKHRHHRYHQRTRKYGDYLYAQDRDKFLVNMREWLLEPNH